LKGAAKRVAIRKRRRTLRSGEKTRLTLSQSSINGGGEVVIYEAPDGQIRLDVRLERDTVWLTQAQMGELFDKNVRTVSEHISNVFKEKELDNSSVVRNFRITARDGKAYNTQFYNLDVIISVGYRVKSRRGIQFRIWATRILKDHLLRGYTLNEKRLRERGLGEIEQAVGLLARTLTRNALVTDQGRAVLEVVQQYTRAWKLLLEYDEGRLSEKPAEPRRPSADLPLNDARAAIGRLRESLAERGEASDLFGSERSDQLHGILGAVEQTFGVSCSTRRCRRGPRICSISSQRSPVRRRQQENRHAAVFGISQAKRHAHQARRPPASGRYRHGRPGAARGRKRAGTKGTDDQADSQSPRRRHYVAIKTTASYLSLIRLDAPGDSHYFR
jgi:DNA ligase (NAD+)